MDQPDESAPLSLGIDTLRARRLEAGIEVKTEPDELPECLRQLMEAQQQPRPEPPPTVHHGLPPELACLPRLQATPPDDTSFQLGVDLLRARRVLAKIEVKSEPGELPFRSDVRLQVEESPCPPEEETRPLSDEEQEEQEEPPTEPAEQPERTNRPAPAAHPGRKHNGQPLPATQSPLDDYGEYRSALVFNILPRKQNELLTEKLILSTRMQLKRNVFYVTELHDSGYVPRLAAQMCRLTGEQFQLPLPEDALEFRQALFDAGDCLLNRGQTPLDRCEAFVRSLTQAQAYGSESAVRLYLLSGVLAEALTEFRLALRKATNATNPADHTQLELIDSCAASGGCRFTVDLPLEALSQANYGEACLLEMATRPTKLLPQFLVCRLTASDQVRSVSKAGKPIWRTRLRLISSLESGHKAVHKQPLRLLFTGIRLQRYYAQADALLEPAYRPLLRQMQKPSIDTQEICLNVSSPPTEPLPQFVMNCLLSAVDVCLGQPTTPADFGCFDFGPAYDPGTCATLLAELVRLLLLHFESGGCGPTETGVRLLVLIKEERRRQPLLEQLSAAGLGWYDAGSRQARVDEKVCSERTPLRHQQLLQLLRLLSQEPQQLPNGSAQLYERMRQELQRFGHVANQVDGLLALREIQQLAFARSVSRLPVLVGSIDQLTGDALVLSATTVRPARLGVGFVMDANGFTDAELLALSRLGCRRWLLFDRYKFEHQERMFNRTVKLFERQRHRLGGRRCSVIRNLT